jgi:hypothetical protein
MNHPSPELTAFLDGLPGVVLIIDLNQDKLDYLNRQGRALAAQSARAYHCDQNPAPPGLLQHLLEWRPPAAAAGWQGWQCSCQQTNVPYLVQSGKIAGLTPGQWLHLAWPLGKSD